MATVGKATLAPTASTFDLPADHILFGTSPAMREVYQKVHLVAKTSLPVLLLGESGTGKELIARVIHNRSAVSGGPFIKVNCPAIPGTLLESELFGYRQGAFTGAETNKPGRVEMAEGGSLFLDEIGDLDLALQAKLLQYLQDGRFSSLGSSTDTQVHARTIYATNRDLHECVQAGTFREDLLYRINVLSVRMPPLRERQQDIPELASYFLAFYGELYDQRPAPLSKKLLSAFQAYSWPGNIRELENLIRRYVIIGSEEALLEDLEDNPKAEPPLADFPLDGSMSLKHLTREATRQVERRIILKVLESNNWHRKRSAKILNISYRALLYKIRDAGLARNRASGSVDHTESPG